MSIKNFQPRSYIKEMDTGFLGIDWRKFTDDWRADHDCKAEERVTVRTLSNGNIAYYAQCPICGNSRAVKKNDVPPGKHPQWRDDIRQLRQEDHSRHVAQIQAALDAQKATKNTQWWKWYNAYLQTSEWYAIRGKVLNRCNNWCEGCGSRPAIHVHHLTYDHVGKEFLFELVGLCQFCHDRIHPK